MMIDACVLCRPLTDVAAVQLVKPIIMDSLYKQQ